MSEKDNPWGARDPWGVYSVRVFVCNENKHKLE